MSSRRKARELALHALYAIELSQNPFNEVENDLIKNQENDELVKDFASQLFSKAVTNIEKLDELIKLKALNWDFERIAILDKLILRIAISEFLYFNDIPPKVSIDEAIEISKKYSTAKSGKFINGILDSVLSELRNTKLLKKSGRGLNEGK